MSAKHRETNERKRRILCRTSLQYMILNAESYLEVLEVDCKTRSSTRGPSFEISFDEKSKLETQNRKKASKIKTCTALLAIPARVGFGKCGNHHTSTRLNVEFDSRYYLSVLKSLCPDANRPSAQFFL
ncbi:hypothetical protein L596_003785 [Steinernema carpocapsae]|uniref:Uncharacterized protein n=1 Tax=Steinernema carpocapsae TaxID=34508 RepID=A0A4V6I852_STECR|nr:hypothetical protein L596_003785 [Steinernema carpocapsae]